MTRAELIARLEAATGPDRELDAEIAMLTDAGRAVLRDAIQQEAADA